MDFIKNTLFESSASTSLLLDQLSMDNGYNGGFFSRQLVCKTTVIVSDIISGNHYYTCFIKYYAVPLIITFSKSYVYHRHVIGLSYKFT